MAKKKIAIGLPLGEGTLRGELAVWLMKTARQFAMAESLSSKYELMEPIVVRDTPADMVRNHISIEAVKRGADYLLMVDDDMGPDYLHRLRDPEAKGFMESSLAFAETVDGPCVIAAPYCSPPPNECVMMFEWRWAQDHPTDFLGQLDMIDRNRAATMRGITQVAALATGLILIDCRVFQVLPPPYFYYEYTDVYRAKKASTEDVTFSRDCAIARIPCYCNWDAWAQHFKIKVIGRPQFPDMDFVNERMQKIVAAGIKPTFREKELDSNFPAWPGDVPIWDGKVPRHEIMAVQPGSFNTEVIFDRTPHAPTKKETDSRPGSEVGAG